MVYTKLQGRYTHPRLCSYLGPISVAASLVILGEPAMLSEDFFIKTLGLREFSDDDYVRFKTEVVACEKAIAVAPYTSAPAPQRRLSDRFPISDHSC